jgi:transposase, IS30 family
MVGTRKAPRRLTYELKLDVRRRVVAGERPSDVAAAVDITVRSVFRIVAQAGGMPPRWDGRSSSRLLLADREEISRGLEHGDTLAVIAGRVGRHPSTIGREVARNGGRGRYRAWRADHDTHCRAARPKPEKLALNKPLALAVEYLLEQHCSPEQIAGRLPLEFPDDKDMRVSHETIYQSLFVHGRGALRKELVSCLRSGRITRRPHKRAVTGRGKMKDMAMIADRPPDVEDRAIPGDWEGDLILGSVASRSSIGTLVERSTRLVVLFPLGQDRTAERTRLALAEAIQTLPRQMIRSITWDQGKEMAEHAQFSIDTGVQVWFCDPHAPWQRGTNENTNGLLRQYFPKGTDLSQITQATCDAVATQMNNRPRKVLGFKTPLESFTELLALTA